MRRKTFNLDEKSDAIIEEIPMWNRSDFVRKAIKMYKTQISVCPHCGYPTMISSQRDNNGDEE